MPVNKSAVLRWGVKECPDSPLQVGGARPHEQRAAEAGS